MGLTASSPPCCLWNEGIALSPPVATSLSGRVARLSAVGGLAVVGALASPVRVGLVHGRSMEPPLRPVRPPPGMTASSRAILLFPYRRRLSAGWRRMARRAADPRHPRRAPHRKNTPAVLGDPGTPMLSAAVAPPRLRSAHAHRAELHWPLHPGVTPRRRGLVSAARRTMVRAIAPSIRGGLSRLQPDARPWSCRRRRRRTRR